MTFDSMDSTQNWIESQNASQHLWYAELSSLKLGNRVLEGDLTDAFIDSGSTFIHLKDDLFEDFLQSLKSQLSPRIQKQYLSGNCWRLHSQAELDEFPVLAFDFGG